ncbi:hypothetical protein [Methanomethylophilus alvi]|uniref:hypothetical protein n=1 Tax=Methanomethylophilus alvi TaxID=1291540 RepID=UPI0037DD505B
MVSMRPSMDRMYSWDGSMSHPLMYISSRSESQKRSMAAAVSTAWSPMPPSASCSIIWVIGTATAVIRMNPHTISVTRDIVNSIIRTSPSPRRFRPR